VAANPDVDRLLAALRLYRTARDEFLSALGCSESNRDPFSEFAERVALAAVGGTLAASRTQKGWDFEDLAGRRVQVRYLANPLGPWVNEHVIDFRGGGCDRYALVVFEGLDAKSLIVFDHAGMANVGGALGKRHPDQDNTLQMGQANYRAMTGDPGRFQDFGVQVIDLQLTEGPR
jgi:hypothetical protein